LAVVVLSQLYAALTPGPAVLAALGYAAAAGVALASAATLLRLAASAAVSVLAAGLTLVLLPATPARYSLQSGQVVPLPETPPENPLDQIADRLAHGGLEVFRVRNASGVDRWPLVVLDGFDGVNWSASWDYRRLGTELGPGGGVRVRTQRLSAELTVAGSTAGSISPWLPSQTWPAAVEGAAPYVAERYGSLLLPGSAGAARYTLSWWQPQIDAAALSGAAIDADVLGALEPIGAMPEELEPVVQQATRGLRPSFQTALLLEGYLKANYKAAQGEDLPTGHGWPQIADFLLRDKHGTSEQFASAYVALARFAGIPARLAVGFRMSAQPASDGTVVVRNEDVLAWPEVAVRDVGWVPLDPIRAATGAVAGSGLAAQAQRARTQLPPPEDLIDPPMAPESPQGPAGDEAPATSPWVALLAVPLVPLVGWPLGVPLAWTLRSWRRRRRAGVLDAWAEVRDRLRAHGVAVTPGMTVR
ncbi:transglutaminase-like domain-containing protein, partial [Actinoplanes sp. NPDC051633]|uniref:transglutaminase-like domain-containing protein n=1 Tax=Actinoplanes sp. NPDC051633 TaxID=3155670 RepID=UPI00342D3997